MKAEELHKLVWMSRPLMQAAEARVEAGLDGTGLTVRMRAVLEILRDHGSQSVPELAVKLDIQRQYVQLMVNETLESGLAEQHPNPRHKRSPLIALTERGRVLIEEIISSELAIMQAIGNRFTDEEISIALNVVCRVTEELKRTEE